MIRVLKAAAERFGWTPAKAPSKRGYGVACGMDAGTWVATMIEAEVDAKKGTVQVKRVVCAQDMGLVVNPEGAKIQAEGATTMGLGYALTRKSISRAARCWIRTSDTYELPRFSWVPKIETVLIDAKDSPPQGGGEPAIIVMGAVIANAIYDRTGARLFQLPMTARTRAGGDSEGLSPLQEKGVSVWVVGLLTPDLLTQESANVHHRARRNRTRRNSSFIRPMLSRFQ